MNYEICYVTKSLTKSFVSLSTVFYPRNFNCEIARSICGKFKSDYESQVSIFQKIGQFWWINKRLKMRASWKTIAAGHLRGEVGVVGVVGGWGKNYSIQNKSLPRDGGARECLKKFSRNAQGPNHGVPRTARPRRTQNATTNTVRCDTINILPSNLSDYLIRTHRKTWTTTIKNIFVAIPSNWFYNKS